MRPVIAKRLCTPVLKALEHVILTSCAHGVFLSTQKTRWNLQWIGSVSFVCFALAPQPTNNIVCYFGMSRFFNAPFRRKAALYSTFYRIIRWRGTRLSRWNERRSRSIFRRRWRYLRLWSDANRRSAISRSSASTSSHILHVRRPRVRTW